EAPMLVVVAGGDRVLPAPEEVHAVGLDGLEAAVLDAPGGLGLGADRGARAVHGDPVPTRLPVDFLDHVSSKRPGQKVKQNGQIELVPVDRPAVLESRGPPPGEEQTAWQGRQNRKQQLAARKPVPHMVAFYPTSRPRGIWFSIDFLLG